MTIHCELTVKAGATPEQLSALGAALWRWYLRTSGGAGPSPYVNSQPLADLIAGRFPEPDPFARRGHGRGPQFRLRDEQSADRRATADDLRQEIPAEGVEDLLVDGISWHLAEVARPPATPFPAGPGTGGDRPGFVRRMFAAVEYALKRGILGRSTRSYNRELSDQASRPTVAGSPHSN